MNLSRKEFLTRGIFSLGRLLADGVQPPAAAAGKESDTETDAALAVRVDNNRCLAQRGGCFTCLEHCPAEALWIEAGIGIGVDPLRCTGCGVCADVCPLEPKAINLAVTHTK